MKEILDLVYHEIKVDGISINTIYKKNWKLELFGF